MRENACANKDIVETNELLNLKHAFKSISDMYKKQIEFAAMQTFYLPFYEALKIIERYEDRYTKVLSRYTRIRKAIKRLGQEKYNYLYYYLEKNYTAKQMMVKFNISERTLRRRIAENCKSFLQIYHSPTLLEV